MLSRFEFEIQRSSIGVAVHLVGKRLGRNKSLTEQEIDECIKALIKAAEDLKELRDTAHSQI